MSNSSKATSFTLYLLHIFKEVKRKHINNMLLFLVLLLLLSLQMQLEAVRIPVASPTAAFISPLRRGSGGGSSSDLLNGKDIDDKIDRYRNGVPAAVMPGSAVGNAVIFGGIANAFSLFNSIIVFRIALSWFPQLPRQFPILRPVFTVTDPYLNFFRRQIPPIGGFDISAIPALFLLDIMGQAVVAFGAEIPENIEEKLRTLKEKHRNSIDKTHAL